MILEVEEQIIETARSINLVIHTKDKLEQLQGRIDSYMGDEVVNLDSCKEALEKVQKGLVNDLCVIVSEALEQLEEEEAVLEEAIDQSKEDQEDAVAARGSDITFRVPTSEASQKRQAGRLTIDDILLSMGDRGDHVRQVTGGSVMSATEEGIDG